MKIRLVVLAVLGIALLASPVAQAAVTHGSAPNAPVAPDNGCTDDTSGNGAGGISDIIAFVEAGTISKRTGEPVTEEAFTTSFEASNPGFTLESLGGFTVEGLARALQLDDKRLKAERLGSLV